MTRLEMQTRALQRIGEDPTAPKFTTAQEAQAALDRAQRLFCLFTWSIEITGPLVVAEGISNPLSTYPRYLRTLRLRNAAGAKIRPSTYDELAARNPLWRVASGNPERYVAHGWDLIEFGTSFSGALTFTLTFMAEPAPLLTDSAVPEIALVYHPLLIDYAVADLRSKEGGSEFQKTLPHLARFVDGMLAEIAHRRTLYQAASYDAIPREWNKPELLAALGAIARPERRQERAG
jgi:hypothetical protein